MNTHVLLLSDDELLSEFLRIDLAGLSIGLETAGSWDDAAVRLLRHDIRALVVDVAIPLLQSLQRIRTVRMLNRSLVIVVIASETEEASGVAAVRAGANSYLVKSAVPRELVRHLTDVPVAATPSTGATSLGRVIFERHAFRIVIDGTPVALSPREVSLLGLLILLHGRPVSKQQIQDAWMLAPSGWAGDRRRGNSVQVYVHRLRSKLAGTQLTIRTLRARGYCLELNSVRPHEVVPIR
ncbi:winged helix-turn-helix domain-containing protein [Scleromatobacter humisilvae]|uniref:Winged helix-turn-helix domain-containing protein n=1 Tax=Scleromatobacter humisilvae TaxID=2897159 RepID=A0A9X2C306_9BURK|nr:winged helix-turn-helix domain-containing protein [Scleromatobacter humisilvae]MCK9689416.1 winged helix-turn-helix domain-containing protein [Scleromatobacter humisilvae]